MSGMRIGFDVSQTAGNKAGCAVFAHEMLTHLVEAAPGHTFLPYPAFGGFRTPSFAATTRPERANVEAPHHGLTWTALNAAWDARGDRHAFLGRPSVVHANSFGVPADLGAPLVYTVYDLSPLDLPEVHTEANRLYCFDGLFEASLRASAFVAISRYTRERFLYWFPHVRPERVHVVYPGARPVIAAPGAAETEALLSRLDLRGRDFWLAVGTIEPRKNYGLLLDAYASLCAAEPDLAPLYIVGAPGWKESSLEPRIRALGLEGRVHCPGFLPDRELAVLYRHCLALIFPSHYEGFGLPVLEAMAHGVPVIASRAASLPEVVGDGGVLIDPHSAAQLGAAMRRVLVEPRWRDDLRERAVRQAARFSWRGAAEQVLSIYDAVAADAARPMTVPGAPRR